ncbi:MAG: hypothetical protein NVS9B6_04240 [Candidatus Limnocylindrales bacterium]
MFRSTPRSDEIEPQQASERLGSGAVLVDVREANEWAAGHATGAIHLPLGHLPNRIAELPAGRELLFLCQSGSRSLMATKIATERGRAAKSVRGGTIAWAKAGLPLER